ncbi:hypothetical protein [Chryseobacterium vrystaatense]|uniref:Outer membrane protein beta-barrel domain-containing protein n=1 Tax=Chryseobacterium vrystaatense TaxID=307480 RepID=A0A1M5DNJ6_9FLAO|nr:hypothetical protein [Chryseobacterium vrystaatense]SHF68475.1 hypothetical protein SAMN02787073_2662 [Chryseobacterium vrystaatense]
MLKKVLGLSSVMMFSGHVFSQNYSDRRSQFVKWNLGLNYSGGSLSNKEEKSSQWVNKYTATLSVDVALSEIFYFDSSTLYLQPFFEVSLPVKNPNNSELKFVTYAGGLHLKKYLNSNFEKSRFFLLGGGKLEYVVWTLDYVKNNKEREYKSTQFDYVLNGGGGYVISDRIEVFALYSKGFGKAYTTTDLDHMTNLSSFSVGVKVTLVKNWWFTK